MVDVRSDRKSPPLPLRQYFLDRMRCRGHMRHLFDIDPHRHACRARNDR
jgi:hypothetical protein